MAHRNVTVIGCYGYATASRSDGSLHCCVVSLQFAVILPCTNDNIAASCNIAGAVIFADSNAAVLRCHRHVVYNADIFVDYNIALHQRLIIEVITSGYLIRHVDIAVPHHHGGVIASLHLTVMVNDNVCPGFTRYIGFVSCQ